MRLDFVGSELVFADVEDAKLMKSAALKSMEFNLGRLERYVKTARGENHDAIVYASGVEFDPTIDNAARFVTERLARIIGVTAADFKFPDGGAVNGVVPATTPAEYHAYLSAGGVHNKYVWRCIDLRSKREARSRAERGMSYVPDPIPLGKHLDRLYMGQVNSDIIPIKSPFKPFTTNFKPMYGLIMTIVACIIGVFVHFMLEMR